MNKWTLITSLVVLGLVVPHVTSADLEHFSDDGGDLQQYLDEEEIDDVLTSSWFSKAIHNVGHWTKKAAHDVGSWTKKAASDVANTVQKGCGVVNSLPGKELIKRREETLQRRGITEDQVAALYSGYKGLKSACGLVG